MCCGYYTVTIQVSIPNLWELEVSLVVRSVLLSLSSIELGYSILVVT